MTLTPEAALAVFRPEGPFAVALSGGADSTALLVACAERWPGLVRAVHVHHGLQSAADLFEQHCAALCTRLEVPLTVCRVDARHRKGQSPEEAARKARYAALAQAALAAPEPVRDVVLAQHADDQIETVVLALSRGAGLPGLAAMPSAWARDGVRWHRPWLGVAGADLRAWLQARGVAWIEDPSNADPRYTRNRIRAHILPALTAVFPHFRDTAARSAAHAAQAQTLLEDLAALDLEQIGIPPQLLALRQLSPARQANVLRHWLLKSHATTPSAAQLDELLRQIAACSTRGHRVHLKVGRGHVRREGATLDWYN